MVSHELFLIIIISVSCVTNRGEGERFITTINLSLSKEMINYDINFLDYLRVHRILLLAACGLSVTKISCLIFF